MIPTDLWHEVVWSDKDFTVVADSSGLRGHSFIDYDVYVNRTGERIGSTNASYYMGSCRQIMNEYRKNGQLKQLREFKKKYPDTLVLFRRENCYVAYLEDADCLGDILNEPMCWRQDGVRYTSFDKGAIDQVLPILVRNGHRVAIED